MVPAAHPSRPTPDDIRVAATRIGPFVTRTRLLSSVQFDAMVGTPVVFKCENEQITGAFKYRGATNAVQSLSAQLADNGVATHSSGNHGAALALAAQTRGVPCHVVVPEGSASVKVEAIRSFGAHVETCIPTMAARAATLAEVIARTGATPIHPYEDPQVIAGQGTAALELLVDRPDIDVVLVPVGGGGLISGTAIAAAALRPQVAVVGAEPEGAADAFASLRSGGRVSTHHPDTICDGLRAIVGVPNLAIMRRHSVVIDLVDDDEVRAAMSVAHDLLGLSIEPSSATVIASLLRHRERFARLTVGAILTGGNVDPGLVDTWR